MCKVKKKLILIAALAMLLLGLAGVDTLDTFKDIRRNTVAEVLILTWWLSGLTVGWYAGKLGVPFVARKRTPFAIGMYGGESPYQLAPLSGARNPVLTAEDVSDVPAQFVADPFMVHEHNTWHMFFEVMNAQTNHGEIGLATSADGLKWTYKQIVLSEPFHLSYPYVFKWQGEYYLVPESFEADSIRLYRADCFPTQWSFEGALLGGSYTDASLFRFDDKWWMFACSTPHEHDTLRLYYADELLGPWIEHPESPIIRGNAHIARPAGRVLVVDGRIIRYAQDDAPNYGQAVRAFEITQLTTTRYTEWAVNPSPVLEPKVSRLNRAGWNARGMHHVDPHQTGDKKWITCVDGYGLKPVIGL
jgi:hypothetical protein